MAATCAPPYVKCITCDKFDIPTNVHPSEARDVATGPSVVEFMCETCSPTKRAAWINRKIPAAIPRESDTKDSADEEEDHDDEIPIQVPEKCDACDTYDVPNNKHPKDRTCPSLGGPSSTMFMCKSCSPSKRAAWISKSTSTVNTEHLVDARDVAQAAYEKAYAELIGEGRVKTVFTANMTYLARIFVEAAIAHEDAQAALKKQITIDFSRKRART